jgi:hypothetical protein
LLVRQFQESLSLRVGSTVTERWESGEWRVDRETESMMSEWRGSASPTAATRLTFRGRHRRAGALSLSSNWISDPISREGVQYCRRPIAQTGPMLDGKSPALPRRVGGRRPPVWHVWQVTHVTNHRPHRGKTRRSGLVYYILHTTHTSVTLP